MIKCLINRLGTTWNVFLRVWLPLLLMVLGADLVYALLTGRWQEAYGIALSFFIVTAAVFLSLIITDIMICAFEGADSSPASNSSDGSDPWSGSAEPSSGNVDCAAAQEALSKAKAQEAQAEADLADKTARVSAAQDYVNTSRTALALALASLTAAIFFPWTLPILLTIVAAATFNLGVMVKVLSTAVADMNRAAMALGAAQAALARAEALVAQACSIVVIPTPPKPGITTNTLLVLAGLHGTRH